MTDEKLSTNESVPEAVAAYAELARIVLQDQPLGAVLTRVAQIAAELIPGVDEASITLVERERARSVAFSGRRAASLDERQYEAGFGPCMDAAASGTTIGVEDTAHDRTYPDFAARAARAGITHTLSFGLPTFAQGRTGAMNLYGTGAPIAPAARDLAGRFAGYAAVAVSNAAVYTGAIEEVDQMREAMASRAVIEQAKGMIMALRNCDAEEAFDVLRDTSSRANRKLRDVAQAVVQARLNQSQSG